MKIDTFKIMYENISSFKSCHVEDQLKNVDPQGVAKCAQIVFMECMSEIQDSNTLPVIKIGATLAWVHSLGILPVQSVSKDRVYYRSDFFS